MKIFQGDCVGNPFKTTAKLIQIIERSTEIKKKTFFKHCLVEAEIQAEMIKFPYDFRFFKSRNIYFYQWSAIEHFYY